MGLRGENMVALMETRNLAIAARPQQGAFRWQGGHLVFMKHIEMGVACGLHPVTKLAEICFLHADIPAPGRTFNGAAKRHSNGLMPKARTD